MLAVVTGAGRGIGRAAAIHLARRGVDVALVALSQSNLDAVASVVRDEGRKAITVVANVASADEVAGGSARVVAELGVPDVVVHAAGIVHRGAGVEATSIASWDEVIGVNLRGSFLLTRAFLPAMRERGRGRFVFVGSISSTIGCGGVASYAASKWGQLGFAKSLAEELRGTELIALSVLPGSVDTDMLKGSGFEPKMTAEEVASTIVYAALDAPMAMNGSAIEIFG